MPELIGAVRTKCKYEPGEPRRIVASSQLAGKRVRCDTTDRKRQEHGRVVREQWIVRQPLNRRRDRQNSQQELG